MASRSFVSRLFECVAVVVGVARVALILRSMFSLVLAQVAVCASALRGPSSVDPGVTRIDVRMEGRRSEQIGVTRRFSDTRGAAMGVAKPAAFLSSAVLGGPVDAIVEVLQGAPVHLTEPNAQVQAASAVMREFAAEVGPRSPFVSRVVDPDLSADALFCDRDYSQLCPVGFSSVGGGLCAPLDSYEGPCAGEARSFRGLPIAAKERWSAQCAAAWPCKECARDFGAPCPEDWLVDVAGMSCSPPTGYAGPCSGPINFAGYNPEMLHQFSESCGAFWACSS